MTTHTLHMTQDGFHFVIWSVFIPKEESIVFRPLSSWRSSQLVRLPRAEGITPEVHVFTRHSVCCIIQFTQKQMATMTTLLKRKIFRNALRKCRLGVATAVHPCHHDDGPRDSTIFSLSAAQTIRSTPGAHKSGTFYTVAPSIDLAEYRPSDSCNFNTVETRVLDNSWTQHHSKKIHNYNLWVSINETMTVRLTFHFCCATAQYGPTPPHY
jgi:hypothetical protein